MISAVLVAFLAVPSTVFAALGVSVSFGAEKTFTDVDNFHVVAKVTNSGDETLTFLNDPGTLLTPQWKTNIFSIVSADGVVPQFDGVAVKWSPFAAIKSKSFTVIDPGRTVEFTHAIGAMYKFRKGGPRTYKVTATREAGTFTHITASGKLVSLRADIPDDYSATLKGNLVASRAFRYVGGKANRPSLGKRVNSFVGCTWSQETSLTIAAGDAQVYANKTLTYLAGTNSSTTRYKTWFGLFDLSRKSTVLSHFSHIGNGQLANYTFDCSNCTDPNLFAFVYPNNFGRVYLCGAFWKACPTGTDSKAGTLIHESSHFTANGGTKDFVYGQADCRTLAINNPSQAIMNADSHEYFAENNDPLP